VPRREVRCSGVNIKGTTTLIICFCNGQILYKILSEDTCYPLNSVDFRLSFLTCYFLLNGGWR
jgi:hypothetical protein